MKIWLKRAIRTFVQAAVGFVSANAIMYFSDIGQESFKNTLCGIITAAVAAGLAAVMNMKEV